jgi:hypothetical protein
MAKPCAHERETLTSNWPFNMDVIVLRYTKDTKVELKISKAYLVAVFLHGEKFPHTSEQFNQSINHN